MKVKIICPTLRQATFAWERAISQAPDLIEKVNRNELSLLTKTGNLYIFDTDRSRSLLGWHGAVVSIDEFELRDYFREEKEE